MAEYDSSAWRAARGASASTAARIARQSDQDRRRLDVEQALVGTISHVLQAAQTGKSDRVWSADSLLDDTNPMGLAYGACGTMLFLHDTNGPAGVPEDIVDWLVDHLARGSELAPGLYVGVAGIAYTLLEIGRTDEAGTLMTSVPRSPLAFSDPGMLYGVAGWGHASLHFWRRTGAGHWLDQASRAGEHLLRVGQRDSRYLWWDTPDEFLHYGFGRGASGISLFLGQLYSATGQIEFRNAALGALDFDVSRRTETVMGWQWGRYEGDNFVRPYWMQGSAGIGAVAVRLRELVGEDRDDVAHRIARDSFCKFSANPNLFEGLAGIGELMIDMACASKDESYLDDAWDIAESILLFVVRRPSGIAWPGRNLERTVCDLATGAAGIGLYLARLLRPSPRRLVDLPGGAGDGTQRDDEKTAASNLAQTPPRKK